MKHDATGRSSPLMLPVCLDCDRTQYPPREVCRDCLSPRVERKEISALTTILATTCLHHTDAENFRDQLPIRLASVSLAGGSAAIVFLDDALVAGDRAELYQMVDASGQAYIHARCHNKETS